MTKDRWLFTMCVVCAIALVVFGWFFTIRRTLADGFLSAKQEIVSAKAAITNEFQEAPVLKPNVPGLKQTIGVVMTSKQLIASLKTRIETEMYASKKISTPATTQ